MSSPANTTTLGTTLGTTLSADHCYPALLARDARFDGLWFVGVSSTGIYCRPVCRVKAPRRENCSFFANAAQAEAAGYRPCLRCRPETAPARDLRWSVTDASRTLARQAAQLIES
ncbi:MAG TPA: Ada metal-binding domain-containing protein, partial [Burkholderiaceae bacterium]|nr:Ada metal-binding domain-containing protein [Burkholderiaceae bacterium]